MFQAKKRQAFLEDSYGTAFKELEYLLLNFDVEDKNKKTSMIIVETKSFLVNLHFTFLMMSGITNKIIQSPHVWSPLLAALLTVPSDQHCMLQTGRLRLSGSEDVGRCPLS